MSGWVPRARAAFRVLRAEGMRAAGRRLQDHLAEARRRRAFAGGRPTPGAFRAAVLNVLSTAPTPWSGGVPTLFAARRRHEELRRATAVLFPEGRGYRLELTDGEDRRALRIDGPFDDAVRRAGDLAGARACHVEGTHQLPLAGLERLARVATVLVSVHDFALFCRRPHLAEWPGDRFCDYSRDAARCAACLRATWPVPDDHQEHHRAAAAAFLTKAAAIVFQSRFLQATHARLFPGALPTRQCVIAPSTLSSNPPARPRADGTAVALVGAVHPHKGGRVFEEVARLLDRSAAAPRLEVVGGGDPNALGRLRRLPRVHVTGYYRSGALGDVLRQRRIGLALLLSIVPEAYCMALDECLAAGVPVIAFDHGAPAERIRATGAGILVDPSAGAAGVLDAIERVRDGRERLVVPDVEVLGLPTAAAAAGAHLDLYREMGLLDGVSANR